MENKMEKGVVKLSLEDAKKLYDQGGNFRTIALNAYSKEELVLTPKDGDFMFVKCAEDSSFIFIKSKGVSKTTRYVSYNCKEKDLHYSKEGRVDLDENISYIRLAYKEEKQILLDAMHKEGVDWDPINKKIIPYKWRASLYSKYYSIGESLTGIAEFEVITHFDTYSFIDARRYDNNNYFRTKKEAQAVADKINNVF